MEITSDLIRAFFSFSRKVSKSCWPSVLSNLKIFSYMNCSVSQLGVSRNHSSELRVIVQIDH